MSGTAETLSPESTRRRAGCWRGCFRATLASAFAVGLSCAGGTWWLTAAPPAVTGEVGDPTWAGRSDHDVFTSLRGSYLRDAEPLLRDRCYSCHTGPGFDRDLPWVVTVTGIGRSFVDAHVRDGVRALDLGWGFPFARDGEADLTGLQDALEKLERSVASRTMPPPSFLAAHPSAALAPAEQDALLAWIRDAQARLGFRSKVGVTDDERARLLLVERCEECHGPASSALPRDVAAREALVRQGFVLPGRPDTSPLLEAVESGRMPKGEGPRLTPDEIALLRRWISDEAPVAAPVAPALGPLAIRQRVLDDLERLPAGKRRFARYIVADHLASVRADAFGRYEAGDALASALFTASRSPDQVPPLDLIDGRLYRFFLSDFGWDAAAFEEVERSYPLAFDPVGEGAELGEEIRKATGSTVDVMALDWFVYAITQPPLYSELVGFPASLDVFERTLGVDRCAGGRGDNDDVMRAGFRHSGVSHSNRVVERHGNGAYWLSYDFSRSEGVGDIFANPLGPECTGLTPAFRQDGGEIIWSLPNGWQGYALVDGQGRRLDVDAPLTIVSASGDPITNPRSCMGCHRNGIIPVNDEVRRSVPPGSAFISAVEALYPEPMVMAAAVAQDTQHFLSAKMASGVSPLRRSDPVAAISARFEGGVASDELSAFLGVPSTTVEEAMRGASFDRKTVVSHFDTIVLATGAGRPRPPEEPVPFDNADRVAAQPDEGVFELDSGYRMLRVGLPTGSVFLGEEVTQGLWRSILGEEPPTDCMRGLLQAATVDLPVLGDDLPVYCLTPALVVPFANAMSERDGLVPVYVLSPDAISWRHGGNGYRLPTLEEWQAAAGPTPFAGATAEDEVCSVANVLDRSDLADLLDVVGERPRPFSCDEVSATVGPMRVASFGVAPSGLHDLTGNVAELVWTAPRDGRLALDRPVVLVGGSFLSGPAQASSAGFLELAPGVPSPESGLRLARDGTPRPETATARPPGLVAKRAAQRPVAQDREAARQLLWLLLSAPSLDSSHGPAPLPTGVVTPPGVEDWSEE